MQIENEELKEARRLADELRDRWIDIYDCGPLALLTLDSQGLIQDLNQAAAELLRASDSKRHLTGSRLRRYVREPDQEVLGRHLVAGAAGSQPVHCSVRLLDGTPVELWTRRIRAGSRLFPTAMIDGRSGEKTNDETQRLREAEKDAREAIRAKDQFIAALSHELRTPLTPVLAAVTALQGRSDLPPQFRGMCAMIRRNIQTEARLIDDLLDVSRLTQGKMTVHRQATDAHAAVHEVIETLDGEMLANHVSLELCLEAPRHTVLADPVRMKQVLWNLVRNAVKFTPEGGRIQIHSWNDHGMSDKGRLHLEVSDNGFGFDPASASRLFNAFEQGTETPERNGGLGLGLAICKGIMDLHGGSIAATSPGPGLGARFVIEIETVVPVPAVDVIPAPPHPAKNEERPRILLVEDDGDTADVLQELLEDAGYQVRSARSAKAALSVDLDTVDVVISDIGLPDLSGLDLMRSLQKHHRVRAVALSGYGTEADILASREAGFSAHLTKPVDFDRLLATIHRIGTAPAS